MSTDDDNAGDRCPHGRLPAHTAPGRCDTGRQAAPSRAAIAGRHARFAAGAGSDPRVPAPAHAVLPGASRHGRLPGTRHPHDGRRDAGDRRAARRHRRQGAFRQGDPRGPARPPHRLRGPQSQGPGDRVARGHRARLHPAEGGSARCPDPGAGLPEPAEESDDPYAALPHGAVVGSSSVRRQAQLLHAQAGPERREHPRKRPLPARQGARRGIHRVTPGDGRHVAGSGSSTRQMW